MYPFFENVKENTGINRTVKMTENIEDKYVEKNESMKGKISLNTIGKQRKKQGRLYAAEEKERVKILAGEADTECTEGIC